MWQLSSLEGKVAFVTGASRGIGQSIAMLLGKMEATVVGSATSEAGAEGITHFLKNQGIKGRGIVLDLGQPHSIVTAVEKITEEIGAPVILVNNAGVARDNLVIRMKEEEWATTLQTNLTGVFQVTKACLRGMLKARWGRIISLSSVVGSTGNAGQANYAATKAGVIGFSKSLAREIASRGITVNVVAPGFIDTDMTQVLAAEMQMRQNILKNVPLGELGSPEDIAACVAFLASQEARYITGETVHVNGGMLMS